MPHINYKKTFYSGGFTEEYSLDDGTLHREDGPASILHLNHGSVIKSYYHYGKLHRIGGPAIILRRATGTVFEGYSIYGKPPEDRPANIVRDAAGTLIEETWYKNGLKQSPINYQQPKPEPAIEGPISPPQRPLASLLQGLWNKIHKPQA